MKQVQVNGRGQFLFGKREGDFVFVFYRDPNGSIPNQTKAFRADGSDVEVPGDVIRDEDALRSVRLERVWVRDLPKSMQDEFCKCSGVKCLEELMWAPGKEPVLRAA